MFQPRSRIIFDFSGDRLQFEDRAGSGQVLKPESRGRGLGRRLPGAEEAPPEGQAYSRQDSIGRP
jgi:hypothetical protein